MDADQNRVADYLDWDFPSLAYLWDSQIRAIVTAAERLESLSEDDRVRSMTLLAARVRAFAHATNDEWLIATAFAMVEDLFKSYFNHFAWGPSVQAYVAATAGEVMKELTRRGFVLHYVVDNTLGQANLSEVLIYLPQLFETAGLAVTGPQLMAAYLMMEDDVPLEISRIAEYRDRGHAAADELVGIWHRERQSSFYLNMDFDDDKPALSMDVALSACDDPKAIVVFRQLLPVPGTTSQIRPPEGIELPDLTGREESPPMPSPDDHPDEEGEEENAMDYSWKYHIKGWGAVFHEGNIAEDTREDTLARRDKLVALLRESDWYAEQPEGEDSALAQRVRELAATDDDFEVGNLIIAIYDLADAERAWLDPDGEGVE